MEWKKISNEEAKNHPLYGVGGWLKFFIFSLVFGLIIFFGQLLNTSRAMGYDGVQLLTSRYAPEVFTYFRCLLAWNFISCTYIIILAFKKCEYFRSNTTILLLAGFPVSYILANITLSSVYLEDMLPELVQWILSCTIWVTYLNKSRRVRVTYEKKVLEDGAVGSFFRLEKDYIKLGEKKLRIRSYEIISGALIAASLLYVPVEACSPRGRIFICNHYGWSFIFSIEQSFISTQPILGVDYKMLIIQVAVTSILAIGIFIHGKRQIKID